MQIWQRGIQCRSLNPHKYSVVHLSTKPAYTFADIY